MRYLSLILILLVLAGCTAQTVDTNTQQQDNNQGNTNSNNQQNNNNMMDNGMMNGGISLSELQKHDTNKDCWVAYNGKVYDVTAWLPQHPGGSRAISNYCGTSSEFTSAFTRQHGTRMASMLMTVAINEGDFVG